ncbi:unnamed protein product [Arabidopsis arenosa]|uniref:RRM domain-containing protein n=1 Tax=Arabidopsis arenosa TaxID=38785 RepID=A0A8S2ATK2_ARAAE|nr:unnamed protein product [Arabidopsis arenosa]
MATCSKKSGTKVNLLGKRKPEDYLEFKPVLKKHRDNLEHKVCPIPKSCWYCIDHKVWYEDYLRQESLPIDDYETPHGFVEQVLFVTNLSPQTKISDIMHFFKNVGEVAVAIRKKTLFIANLSHKTKPSHIINFFKDVGEVVHVRLIVDNKGKLVGYGFVEFASTNEAKKALEKKNGEYLHDRKISLGVARIAPHPTPKYCIDHKVWNEDYLRRENLLAEEDEAVEGLDETPVFVEDLAVRKKTLFVANLYHKTRLSHIISFFKDVGEVVCVRLIVDHMSERLGCGFVEFASAYEAKKALETKISKALMGQFIFLDMAQIALCPLRPKYNLAEKLWYEDYLRQESLDDDLETKPNMKKQEVPLMDLFCGKKITISDDDRCNGCYICKQEG